ncbi:hypothetical protein GCM10010919_01000 [Alishewanella longhuensis]|uniref:Pyrrolo-quinoline quinone repeat domain-containing protein n=2 Tax=Alishewanella longhuensis TaxID=1091037 RepID=A0ABQ3KUI9_9ALTE|nr:hypothetical protein GCM10010919_01000 [Alishewanella longhuensis]
MNFFKAALRRFITLNWLCTFVIAISFCSMQTIANDSLRFRSNTFNNPTALPVTVEQLTYAASLKLPTTVASSPIVNDGIAFIAAENGNLYAIELETMAIKWIFVAQEALSSTPAIADGQLFVLSMDGHLYALDIAHGTVNWSFKTGGEQRFAAPRLYGVTQTDQPVTDPWDFWLSSPLVANDTVFFGSSDNRVYALATSNGKLKWSFKTGGVVHSSPALTDNILLIGSWDGALYALEADSGKEKWRYQTETEQEFSTWLGIQSSPVVDGNTVFLGSRDGYLYSIQLENGTLNWRYDVKRSWVVPTPLVDEHQIYFGTSDTGQFIALNKQTGEEKWRIDTKVWTYSSPLHSDNAVMVGNMAGNFYVINKKDGQILTKIRSRGAEENRFGAIAKSTGRFDYKGMATSGWYNNLYSSMQRILHSGGFLSSPLWYQDKLILVTTDGELMVYAVK